jgi:ketosteroid isomerase-like protein
MKPIKFLPFLSLLFLLGACNDNERTEEAGEEVAAEEATSPNKVIARWSDAWSNNDTEVLQEMTAEDVVLLMNGREVPHDSIRPWMVYNASSVENLQSESLFKGSQGDVAYDSGTFRHNFAEDTLDYRGSYTFIWEREEANNQWKVKVMHLAANVDQDTISSE